MAAGSLVRAIDGHCSRVISGNGLLLCDRGRVCWSVANSYVVSKIVDIVTGAVLPLAAILNPAADTSGALVWLDEKRALRVGSCPGSNARALPIVESLDTVRVFRYGVCVVRNGDEYHVMRFDRERA